MIPERERTAADRAMSPGCVRTGRRGTAAV